MADCTNARSARWRLKGITLHPSGHGIAPWLDLPDEGFFVRVTLLARRQMSYDSVDRLQQLLEEKIFHTTLRTQRSQRDEP